MDNKENTPGKVDEPANDLTGFVQNVRDMSSSSFSFDLQTSPTNTRRFLCFSPSKRKRIDDKVKSPVKLKNIKLGKNNYFNDGSEIEPTKLEFQPIDYDKLNVAELNNLATNSLVNISLKVLEKTESTKVNGKKIEKYAAGDETGVIKLIIWEGEKLSIGSVYNLQNIRLQRDSFNILSLVTPKEGFSFTKDDGREMKTATFSNNDLKEIKGEIKGEIMSIECFVKYRTCDKCNKKLPSTTESSVKCAADGCPNTVKVKFAGHACYVRFNFMTEKKEKLNLTMFTDDVTTFIPDFWKMTDNQFSSAFLDLPELVVTASKKNVVSNARYA
jgi:hypothetical protein